MKFNLKKIKKVHILFFVFLVLLYIPCNSYSFLSIGYNYLFFRICCALLILFGCKSKNVNISILIALCVIVLFYKVNNVCGLKFKENFVTGVDNPFVNSPFSVDMSNTNVKNCDPVTYNKFLEHSNDNSIYGRLYENQVIPKHHDFRSKEDLDRLLKLESESLSDISRGEKIVY